jgi:hypothetical protein
VSIVIKYSRIKRNSRQRWYNKVLHARKIVINHRMVVVQQGGFLTGRRITFLRGGVYAALRREVAADVTNEMRHTAQSTEWGMGGLDP